MENVYLVTVSSITCFVYYLGKRNNANKSNLEKPTEETVQDQKSTEIERNVKSLQLVYLPAHLLALFSDWLQGPYVYQLYKDYGYGEKEIAVLFMAGYISSCLFGGFTGPMSDKYGRKRLGQVFCLLCILNCLSKLSPNFYLLLTGRMLSGISTSCLYSVFESWYVHEHRAVDISNSLLPSTMSIVTSCNSALAIAAGIICDVLVRQLALPPVAPFLAAVPCLLLSFIIITLKWRENYGHSSNSLLQLYTQGLKIIAEDTDVLKIGIIQSTIESSMFIFVYMWTPTLTAGQTSVSLGLVFSTFMISIMLGSIIFKQKIKTNPATNILSRSTILNLCCHMLVAICADQANVCPFQRQICFIAFIVLEMSLGLYFPSIATLRSFHVPESHRSTIINLFRIPLNLFTIIILFCIRSNILQSKFVIFSCTSLLSFVAVFVSYFLPEFDAKYAEKVK